MMFNSHLHFLHILSHPAQRRAISQTWPHIWNYEKQDDQKRILDILLLFVREMRVELTRRN